jgi:hypothetical protein
VIKCKKGLKSYYAMALSNIPEYSEDETKSKITLLETNEVLATAAEYPALSWAGESLERITFANKDLYYIGKMPTIGAKPVITMPDKNPEGVVWVELLDESKGETFPYNTGITQNDNYLMKTYGSSRITDDQR